MLVLCDGRKRLPVLSYHAAHIFKSLWSLSPIRDPLKYYMRVTEEAWVAEKLTNLAQEAQYSNFCFVLRMY